MTPEEKVALLKEARVWDVIGFPGCIDKLIDLVAAREREKWEPAFSKNKPAPKIENGSVHFEAGLYTPLEVQLAIDLLEEREACAKVCETDELCCKCGDECAAAIRSRSNASLPRRARGN